MQDYSGGYEYFTLPKGSLGAPSVHLVVNGRERRLPETVLAEGCSALMSSRGEYLSLEDYTASVAVVLSALERSGMLTFQSGPQTHT